MGEDCFCADLDLRNQRPRVSPDSLPGEASVWRKCIKDPHKVGSSYFKLRYNTMHQSFHVCGQKLKVLYDLLEKRESLGEGSDNTARIRLRSSKHLN